ncbi:hypothetical protein QMZ62_21820 [Serratia sp. PF2-63]|uniref:hypothetical protein n=1 Tax=unclassified Serratia (in: enterobacteria) TaxID=2647522 RepID=UPI0024AEB647|nr:MULTISPECIES: hypothetical protein [unclassified Serratia (in: enterobacteria)]MDI6977463.1 hypothetical protein [Serratia sp. Se-RSBMAAmG]MDI9265587.1 hypothetical protein [Serratia sp. PF2-63]MDI9267219.1 hypothetical protein [Serratia sp. PF-27]
MKFVTIQSSALPEITELVKECVNLGQWLLFKAHSDDANVFFYLKTDKDLYALGKSGKVLTSTPVEGVEMNELYYFSDIPKPISLSNAIVFKH